MFPPSGQDILRLGQCPCTYYLAQVNIIQHLQKTESLILVDCVFCIQ